MTMSHNEAIEESSEAYEGAETHKHGVEFAIHAYIEARGLVLVPKQIMSAIAEGYDTQVANDRFVKVENPYFKEDDGSDPFMVFDICVDPFAEDK